MNIIWIKLSLLITGALFVISVTPSAVRWLRHQRPLPAILHPRTIYQHLPHGAMIVHLLLSLAIILGRDLLSFLPGPDSPDHVGAMGARLIALGGLLFFAAANIIRYRGITDLDRSFDKDIVVRLNHTLKTEGIYRYSRHPIYVGNMLAEFGTGLALLSWPLALYPLVISFPLWHLRVLREEAMLVRQYPVQYRDYMKNVPRWWGLGKL